MAQNRRADDVKVEHIEKQLAEFMEAYRSDRVEARKDRMAMNHSISCLKDSFLLFHDDFKKTYKPFLDESIEQRKYWASVRDENVKKIVGATVMGAVGAVAIGAWYAVKKSLLG